MTLILLLKVLMKIKNIYNNSSKIHHKILIIINIIRNNNNNNKSIIYQKMIVTSNYINNAIHVNKQANHYYLFYL